MDKPKPPRARIPNKDKFPSYKLIHSQVCQDCIKRVKLAFDRWFKVDKNGHKYCLIINYSVRPEGNKSRKAGAKKQKAPMSDVKESRAVS
ncbi:hypothetical protein CYANOKiyG1_56080 [Okeania sp. KiyG1]|nr:hypothetical protein [Okeania sp. KiyG1]GGA37986.1 hypothetical protein CYANOKiyG1_56080 [Okeania sp. KiyG1]